MKILFLICGLKRSIDLVVSNIKSIFSNGDKDKNTNNLHEINIITCLNDKDDNYHDCTLIKKLYIKDIYDNQYRNSLNYSYKVSNGLSIVPSEYDIYVVMRTDMIIEKAFDFSNILPDKLYFSNKNMNQFTTNIDKRINDNIIITRNYNLLIKLVLLHQYNLENTNYLDLVLYDFLENNKIPYERINVHYKFILSKCNVIAIAGDSGSGKSTLLKALKPLFIEETSLSLETDRYHKWERGDANYKMYTHLNPYANYLEKMYEDVYNLKIGNEVYQVDYNHETGKFTQKEKIDSKNNILICGLHTLYENKMNDIVDIKIYVDTERTLLKRWKIERDTIERGYSMEKVIEQIDSRENDYMKYILQQRDNADIIVNFYLDNENIKCKLFINQTNIITKILPSLLKLNYKIEYNLDKLIIFLKNDSSNIDEINIIKNNEIYFKNNFYKEIFYIIHSYFN